LPQIDRRDLTLIAAFQLKAQPLAFVQVADARALDGRDVYEHIFRPVLWLNKAVPLLGIEPLHRSDRHFCPSRIEIAPPLRSERWVTPPHRTDGGLALDRAWEAGRTMKKSTTTDVGIAGKVYKLWPSAGRQLMGVECSAGEDGRFRPLSAL
jgi:hypothetical protein